MKIAICIPHYGDLNPKFVMSLIGMMRATVRANIIFNDKPTVPDLTLIMSNGSLLSQLRNELVQKATAWGANYLLWLDADHSFPENTLVRLLGHNLPVVGTNYPRRTHPTFPTALGLDRQLIWTSKELAKRGIVEEVYRLGLGVCLMDMTILNILQRAAEAKGRSTYWPLFCQQPIPDSTRVIGEDHYFFDRLREAGISAFLDHTLSWDIGHVHEVLLYNEDAQAQKTAYRKSRRK